MKSNRIRVSHRQRQRPRLAPEHLTTWQEVATSVVNRDELMLREVSDGQTHKSIKSQNSKHISWSNLLLLIAYPMF